MKYARLAVALAALALSGAAQAEGVPGQGIWETSLQARDLDGNAVNGPEAFYDTVLDITWLRDADVNGQMSWDTAVTWAAGLDVNGIKGWRLPTMIDTGAPGCDYSTAGAGGTDCGYNVQTKSGDPTKYEAGQTVYSETAHLFYVTLDNKLLAIPGGFLTNTGSFQNVREDFYWYGLRDGNDAWTFGTHGGMQILLDVHAPPGVPDRSLYSMAVREGDVTAVPEPETGAMMLLGLAAFAVAVRRRSV